MIVESIILGVTAIVLASLKVANDIVKSEIRMEHPEILDKELAHKALNKELEELTKWRYKLHSCPTERIECSKRIDEVNDKILKLYNKK